MTDPVRQTAERYLLPIHFDSESSVAIIRKLETAGRRLVSLPGGWAAAVEAAAEKAPFEFTVVTLKLRDGGRLERGEADAILDRLFLSLTGSLDDSFWPALKCVLIADKKTVFTEVFAPRLRSFAAADFRRRFTEPYGSFIGSDTSEEGRLINLRACIALTDVLDCQALGRFILYSRINFTLTSPAEKDLFRKLCEVCFEKRAFTALLNLFFKIDAFDLLTTVFPMTADAFLAGALPGLPAEEKSACLSFVRDLLEARCGSKASANEAWYALIKKYPDEFGPWYDFTYYVYRIAGSETDNERVAAIDAMPHFEPSGDTISWYYTDILSQKLHTCLFETAPVNYLDALEKTAAYNRYGDEMCAVTHPKSLGLSADDLAGLIGLKEPASYVAPSHHYPVRDLVTHFQEAGLAIKDIIAVYRRTYLRAICPLKDLMAAVSSVYGPAELSKARLGSYFYGYPFYAVLTVPESGWTGNRYLGYIRGLNIALGTNTLLLASTVKPAVREQLKPGDVIRFYLNRFDSQRGLLIFRDIEPVKKAPLVTASPDGLNAPLKALLDRIIQRGRILTEDLLSLAEARPDASNFNEQVELNFLFAEACGAAGDDSRLLDDFVYLFQRANKDRHAYRLLKFMPRFHRPLKAGETGADADYEEALKPDRIRAASLFDALREKVCSRRNLFKIYMQTILRDLISLDEVIIKLYDLKAGESADLTDLRDGEQYWLRGSVHHPYRNQPFIAPLQVRTDKLTLMTTRTSPLMEELLAVPDETQLFCRISGYFNGYKAKRILIDEAQASRDLARYMPNEHFFAALKAAISSSYTIPGNPPEDVVRSWLKSDLVQLKGNDFEDYVYQLFKAVCIRRMSLAAFDSLRQKLGRNDLFKSDLTRDIHALRFTGLPHQRVMAVGALRHLLQEEPVGLVTGTYFDSFLRALVDLGSFCRLLREEHPDLTDEALAALMTPYRLIIERVPDDKRTFRVRNVLCDDLNSDEIVHTGAYRFGGLTSDGHIRLISLI